MSDLNVINTTQRIVVDRASSTVSVVLTGPQGPAGPIGEVSLAYLNTQLADVVRDADIADVVRDSDIGDVVRDADISDVIRPAGLIPLQAEIDAAQVDILTAQRRLDEVGVTTAYFGGLGWVKSQSDVSTDVLDLTIEFDIGLAYWTRDDATFQPIISKDYVGRSWLVFLYYNTMYVTISPTGLVNDQISFTFTGFHNLTPNWQRRRLAVTVDVNNGAGNSVARLWERDNWNDNTPTWALRGTSMNAVTSIFNGPVPITIGAMSNGSPGFIGHARSFRVASGIGAGGLPGGTTVAEWSSHVPQQSYRQSNGMMWTIEGDWRWSKFDSSQFYGGPMRTGGLVQVTPRSYEGDGPPEGVVTAHIGVHYTDRTAVSPNPIHWVKRIGSGATGWWATNSPDRIVLGVEDFAVVYGNPTILQTPAMPAWSFDAAFDEYVGSYRGDLTGWKNFNIEFIWSIPTVAAGEVFWYFEIWSMPVDSAFVHHHAVGLIPAVPAGAAVLKHSQLPNFDLQAVSNHKIHAIRCSRVSASAADTYAGDVYLHSVILTRTA